MGPKSDWKARFYGVGCIQNLGPLEDKPHEQAHTHTHTHTHTYTHTITTTKWGTGLGRHEHRICPIISPISLPISTPWSSVSCQGNPGVPVRRQPPNGRPGLGCSVFLDSRISGPSNGPGRGSWEMSIISSRWVKKENQLLPWRNLLGKGELTVPIRSVPPTVTGPATLCTLHIPQMTP
jgi:hypothetical protein